MNRPIGVTLLAMLSGLAGLYAAAHTLQYLHLIPYMFGPVAFWDFDLLGGLMWGLSAAIWAWATVNLWLLRPQALMFITVLAGLDLALAGLSILGGSTLAAMLPDIFFYAIILIYARSPNVRHAFGLA